MIKLELDEGAILVDEFSKFLKSTGFTQRAAAEALGIPLRTVEGLMQGRGFRYPLTLKLAMGAVQAKRLEQLAPRKKVRAPRVRARPKRSATRKPVAVRKPSR